MSVSVTIVNRAEYNRILRRFPKGAKKIMADVVGETTLFAQKRSAEHAPLGASGLLKQTMSKSVDRVAPKGLVFSPMAYARSVHEGGIPQPQTGRTPASFDSLDKWRKIKTPHINLYALIWSLRRHGVQNPTPFFDMAKRDITDTFVRGAAHRAVNRFKRSLKA